MSDATQARRDNALDFLDELDGRHDFLLNELEQLNLRIDSVLAEYSKSRQSLASNGDRVAEPTIASTSFSDASITPDETTESE